MLLPPKSALIATKLRMFGPLIIDEGPSLSTTASRAVAQLMLVWWSLIIAYVRFYFTAPFSDILPPFLLTFWPSSLNNGQFWRPKKWIWGPKKSNSPNPYENPLFAKKQVQIGPFWPQWPHLYFPSAYRGSPPCTLSRHPNIREIHGTVMNKSKRC